MTDTLNSLDEPRPCPFCGGAARLHSHRIAEDAMCAFVSCLQCGTQTEHYEDAYAPKAEAIAAWNRRDELTRLIASRDRSLEEVIRLGKKLDEVIEERDRLREALRRLWPDNLARVPDHLPDDFVFPIDVSASELRAVAALLQPQGSASDGE